MPAVAFHGLTITWSCADLPHDPLAELLSGFAPAKEHVAEAPPTTIHFDLRPASEEATADPRGEGWAPAFFHGVVEAHRGPRAFLVWDRSSRVLVPHDGSVIVAQIAPPEREVVRGSVNTVLQVAFALAFRLRGLFHLHAAALILATGEPVLVVGRSGAGKTSTTLALLEGAVGAGGADYLGDDALYLTRTPQPGASPREGFDIVAFPRDFHVGQPTLTTFPRLGTLVGPAPAYGTKRPLDARRAYPGRFRASLSIRDGAAPVVALFPAITDADRTELIPLARADAFGHLLGSSGAVVVEGMPGRDENLALLKALLAAARCYELRLGVDALGDPARIIATRIAELARTIK